MARLITGYSVYLAAQVKRRLILQNTQLKKVTLSDEQTHQDLLLADILVNDILF